MSGRCLRKVPLFASSYWRGISAATIRCGAIISIPGSCPPATTNSTTIRRRQDVCLLTEYARRVIGDQLRRDATDVSGRHSSRSVVEENEGNASIFLTVSDKYFGISMKRAAKLTRLLHSNGFSTIFIFSEDGALKGLMDVGSEQQKTYGCDWISFANRLTTLSLRRTRAASCCSTAVENPFH